MGASIDLDPRRLHPVHVLLQLRLDLLAELRRRVAHRRDARPAQAILTPAAFPPSTYFFRPAGIAWPTSADVLPTDVMPSLARRSLTAGSFTTACSSRWMRSTMGFGVLAGARRPIHELASKPGTVSPTVGTLGSDGSRCALEIAMARTCPLSMKGSAPATAV